METITKIILIKNAVETLGYFSEQIALELEHLGYDTYFVDYDNLYETVNAIPKFAELGHTALLTFNYIGLGEEDIFRDASGRLIWEKYEMQYLNILVDHPFYYHSKLLTSLQRLTVFCIDREHVAYMRRFYPEIRVKFLPLAGNVLLPRVGQGRDITYEEVWNYEQSLLPYEKRRYDVVFTANYVPMQQLEQKLLMLDEEYAAFYREIASDLIRNPAQSVDVVMERHIKNELGSVSESDMRGAMSGMLLVDLLIRTYFRGEIVRTLAEADIKVHVFGADWDKLACKKPWNIIKNEGQESGGMLSSALCVEAVRNAKISLNVMPWFKDGAHDRIFTAMLQRTVALTDDSRYLREEFADGKDIAFFSLMKPDKLPDIIYGLLRDEENAACIAENGYMRAKRAHTWRERTQELISYTNGD